MRTHKRQFFAPTPLKNAAPRRSVCGQNDGKISTPRSGDFVWLRRRPPGNPAATQKILTPRAERGIIFLQATHFDSHTAKNECLQEGQPLLTPHAPGAKTIIELTLPRWFPRAGRAAAPSGKDGGKAMDGSKTATKKPERKRQKQIVIRMDETEHAKLKKRVEESGKTQAEFLRKAIFETEIIDTDGAKELAAEMKKIGVNLNQIARWCNERSARDLNAAQMELLRRNVKTIKEGFDEGWRLLRALVAARQ